jgi:hypothetical protein
MICHDVQVRAFALASLCADGDSDDGAHTCANRVAFCCAIVGSNDEANPFTVDHRRRCRWHAHPDACAFRIAQGDIYRSAEPHAVCATQRRTNGHADNGWADGGAVGEPQRPAREHGTDSTRVTRTRWVVRELRQNGYGGQ